MNLVDVWRGIGVTDRSKAQGNAEVFSISAENTGSSTGEDGMGIAQRAEASMMKKVRVVSLKRL